MTSDLTLPQTQPLGSTVPSSKEAVLSDCWICWGLFEVFFQGQLYHGRNMEFPSDVVSSKLLLPACWDRKEESPGLLLSSGGSSCLSEGTILPVSSFLFLCFIFFSFTLFLFFPSLSYLFIYFSFFFLSLFLRLPDAL